MWSRAAVEPRDVTSRQIARWRPAGLRVRGGALALLLILAAPPALAAQQLFVDPAGDVRGSSPDGRLTLVNQAGSAWPNLDIRAGGVLAETDDVLSFYVNVTRLEAQQDPPIPRSEPTYFLHFRYGEQGYRLVARTSLDSPGSAHLGRPLEAGWIELAYDDGVYHRLDDVGVVLDFQQNQVVWEVPRALVRDHVQAPLGRGEVLWDIYAQSRAMGWFGVPVLVGQGLLFEVGPPAFSDQGPNGRERGEEYVTVAGRQLHAGALLAASEDPVRWTNGEATTFVYYIRLANSQSGPLEVRLGHEGADPMWQVAYSDVLTVPGNDAINVTYHVAIPFGHHHGKLHNFDVTFETADGRHWARQPLAVYWPAIPQPAGHHPQVWMHSRLEPREPPFESMGARVHGWWSAAAPEDEPFDTQEPVPAHRIEGPPPGAARSTATWLLRLEPSLRMGLDFLLDGTVSGQVAMRFPLQAQDPSLQLDLVHVDRRFIMPRETLLASANSSIAGTASDDVVFPIEAPPLAASDLVRHLSRADLEVRLRLTGVFAGQGFENPSQATPLLVPGGTDLRLPLREYHDPLDTVFWTDASATITVGPEGQEKEANPGDQVLFTFLLHYQGTFETSFRVELSGVNAAWARVVGDAQFRMPPGATREVAVAVQPPAGATRGDYAEIAIKAIGTANAAVQAGMVVRAAVTTDADVADETEQVLAKQADLSTPPAGRSKAWLWSLLALPLVVAGAVLWRVGPRWGWRPWR